MKQQLKLWHLKQSVNNDYDTYGACVVAAYDEEQARQIHPSGYNVDTYLWAKPKHVQVTYLGEACSDHIKPNDVICASFRAG